MTRRVAFWSPGWPAAASHNGIVSYIENVRTRLPEYGYRATVLAHLVPEGSEEPDVVDASIALRDRTKARQFLDSVRYRMRPEDGQAGATAVRAALDEAMRRAPVDLLEIEETAGTPRFLARQVALPIVVRLHGPWFLNGPANGAPEDAAFARRVASEAAGIEAATAITAPSADVLEAVRKRHHLELAGARVIPNPGPTLTPEQRWSPSEYEHHRVLFVGRFDRHKGGDLVLAAFARVAQRFPDARLTFVGPDRGLLGPSGTVHFEQYLEENLGDRSVMGKLEYLGVQPGHAIQPLRRRAHVVVVASRYENFPMTALESLATGTPMVASAAGGIQEIVRDGKTGLLFTPGDPEALAERICQMFEDEQRLRAFSAAALADFEQRFTPSVVAKSTAEFYDSVLDAVSRTPKRKRRLAR